MGVDTLTPGAVRVKALLVRAQLWQPPVDSSQLEELSPPYGGGGWRRRTGTTGKEKSGVMCLPVTVETAGRQRQRLLVSGPVKVKGWPRFGRADRLYRLSEDLSRLPRQRWTQPSSPLARGADPGRNRAEAEVEPVKRAPAGGG